MSKTYRHDEHRLRVRGLRHEQPDLRGLARVLIEFAQAEAEAAATAEHQNGTTKTEERTDADQPAAQSTTAVTPDPQQPNRRQSGEAA